MTPNPEKNPFDQAAEAFRRFRPPYPEILFEKIMEGFPPPHDRAIDLGAGTGLATLPLCSYFREVIAIEPSVPMAEKLAELSPKIQVMSMPAEDIPNTPAVPVDLVAVASALYWMDGELALEKVSRWLRPGGRLAVFRYGVPDLTGAVKWLIDREYTYRWDAFRHPRLRDEGYSQRTVRSSPFFEDVQVHRIPNRLDLDPHRLVGFYSSTSYGAAYVRSLSEPVFYLEDLEREIREAANSDLIPVEFNIEVVLAQRIADGGA